MIKKSKILVVDDDPDIVEILRYNLSLEGYDVKTASNGKECLKKVKNFIPHVILLDVMMPVMDGIQTCSLLKLIPTLMNTRIIFLSARNEDFTQISAFDAGADDYISKPVKPKILMKKIASIVKRLNKQTDLKEELDLEEIKINRKEYTVYKNGNSSIQTILDKLSDWMTEQGFNSIDEFRGKMNYKNADKSVAFERIQFMKYFSGIE